jgi:anti-sigma factor RsiW
MTGCERFQEELDAYHDGALTATDREQVEQHVRACGPCRSVLGRLEQLDSAIRALPRQEPSPEFTARFHARLAEAEGEAPETVGAAAPRSLARRARRRWRGLAWATGAAGAAAAAAALFLAGPLEQPELVVGEQVAQVVAPAAAPEPRAVVEPVREDRNPAATLPEKTLTGEDWQIVADKEAFDLLVNEKADLDLLNALDVLENWDAGKES